MAITGLHPDCNPSNALRGRESALEYFVQTNRGASTNIKQDTYEDVQVLDIKDLPSGTTNHTFEVHARHKFCTAPFSQAIEIAAWS